MSWRMKLKTVEPRKKTGLNLRKDNAEYIFQHTFAHLWKDAPTLLDMEGGSKGTLLTHPVEGQFTTLIWKDAGNNSYFQCRRACWNWWKTITKKQKCSRMIIILPDISVANTGICITYFLVHVHILRFRFDTCCEWNKALWRPAAFVLTLPEQKISRGINITKQLRG